VRDAYSVVSDAPFASVVLQPETLMIEPIAIVDIGCGSQLKMLSIEYDDNVVEIYRSSGTFEPTSLILWSQLAKRSAYAIDVGAYTGIYALMAAAANRHIKVAAVEPTKQVFSRLCINIRINGFQAQIAPLHFAAGDRFGDCLLNHYDTVYCLGSGSTLVPIGGRPVWYSETVRMLPLDILPAVATCSQHETVIELPQADPDIVKIDVEGYETGVLAGMRRTIHNFLPIFIIECLSPDALRAAYDYLAEFSYTPLLIDDENRALIADLGQFHWERTRNIMFYPRTKQDIIMQVQQDSGVAMRF
jgi:FkbM family methyltransferase